MIDDIISQEQSAFIKERQIIDGPLILNEVISWCKSKKVQSLLFKVDFQKAFDSVFDSVLWDHNDVIFSLISLGLVIKLSLGGSVSAIYSSKLIDKGMFAPIFVGKDNLVPISHLFFADDAMFIGKWSCKNVNAMMMMLQWVFLTSGLKVNVHKSSLYGVGVRPSEVQSMADRYGCLANNLPFTHLGVKVGTNMLRVNSWNEVPEGILSHLESLRNSFFLGADMEERKTTWVCWRKVMTNKHLGGLGVSSDEQISILCGKLSAIHGNDGAIDHTSSSRYGHSVWEGVLKAIARLKSKGFDLMEYCKIVIGTGNTFKFWHDKWYGDVRLKDKFYRCFNLDLQKDAIVAFKL
ncbi:hypothetical protein Tco_1036248 [Tanacetum coccineum]